MPGPLRRFAQAIGPQFQPPPPNAPHLNAKMAAGIAGIILAAVLATLDERLTTAGMADLLGGFGYSADEGSWITTAYNLGTIAIIPLTPWLSQTFSVRRVAAFQVCLTVAAATACPVAPDYFTAMACRLLQGVGEGALLPMLLLSLLRFTPPYRRPVALVVYGLVVSLVPLLTDSAEGVIGDLYTWRAIFWFGVVLGPPALFLILLGLPEEEYKWETFRETDYFGLLYLVVGISCIAVMLGQGQRLDWFDSGLIDALAAGAVFFIGAFLVNEAVTQKPLFKESLFKNPNLVVGLALISVFAIAVLGVTFLMPQDQMQIRHLRPIQIGNIELRLVGTLLVMAPVEVLLLKFLDVRLVLALGLGLCAFGNWRCVWITPVWYGPDFNWFLQMQVASWMLILPSNALVTTSTLKQPDLLTGSAFFNIFRTLGTAFGTALLDAIVTVRERVHSDNDLVAGVNPLRIATQVRIIMQGPARIEQAERAQSTVMSFADAYGWLAIILVCALTGLLLLGPTKITRKPGGGG